MTADHWTELISAGLALLGVISGTVASIWIAIKVKTGRSNHDRENLAHDLTSTPADPGVVVRDIAALELARDANKRLDRIEEELSTLRTDYENIQAWVRGVHLNWEDILKQRKLPPLPPRESKRIWRRPE